jgi:dienelactone hydrolase
MHGCSGVYGVEHGWEAALGQAGYATFVVNSFGGRGSGAVCSDAKGLSPADRIADAYGALRILSTHPRLDGQRVALMGFSHGGVVTTMSATAWAKHVFVLAGQPSFRAFVAFYPYCNWTFPEMWQLSGPLRVHTGALDDWTPAKPCQEMVARLRAAGYDAEISVYRGARHAFDNGEDSADFLPDALNPAACAPRLGSILGPLNPEVFAGCLRRGATIGGNRAAMAQARATVLGQLAELLK